MLACFAGLRSGKTFFPLNASARKRRKDLSRVCVICHNKSYRSPRKLFFLHSDGLNLFTVVKWMLMPMGRWREKKTFRSKFYFQLRLALY